MQVHQYNNLDTLNTALKQFESEGLKVLTVKIFENRKKSTASDPDNIFFVIVEKLVYPDRFAKQRESF